MCEKRCNVLGWGFVVFHAGCLRGGGGCEEKKMFFGLNTLPRDMIGQYVEFIASLS